MLSNGERMMIDRRRRKENQLQAAKRLGKNRSWVWMAESGRIECDKIKLGKVALNEMAWILRKRKGWTQEKLGKKLGYSREWIKQMELGKVDSTPLVNCWKLA